MEEVRDCFEAKLPSLCFRCSQKNVVIIRKEIF